MSFAANDEKLNNIFDQDFNQTLGQPQGFPPGTSKGIQVVWNPKRNMEKSVQTNGSGEEDKGAQQQKYQPNSQLLSARELLFVKVPARLIKVAGQKAECNFKNNYENKAE